MNKDKIDYDMFESLFGKVFMELEKTLPLVEPEDKRNWAVVNTELEKVYAYYKWFCEKDS